MRGMIPLRQDCKQKINHGRDRSMNTFFGRCAILLVAGWVATLMTGLPPAMAADAAAIDGKAKAALDELYKTSPAAKALGKQAIAVLVFPEIIKAGLLIGGQRGDGALVVKGQTVAYYNTTAASYGLQAGVQKFGYALFLMTESARAYIDTSGGWEVGVGPSFVLVDEGIAKSITSTTAKADIYAFVFGQKGLMGGIGIQGAKITRIDP